MPVRRSLVSLALVLWTGCLSRASDPIPAVGGRGPADLAPGRDSVVRLEDGTLAMLPFAHLALDALRECSGLVRQGDAFFAHNDSGDAPVLYRSTTLDFAAARTLAVPGAKARDWEDICTIGDDLLVFDIGDNRRERNDLVIYRVRYREARGGEPGRLDRVATYPIAYPNGRHDAEAGFAIDGVVHIVSKARDERETFVYRFDVLEDASDLASGMRNVPRLVGTLDVGEGETVTAGTFDPGSGEVLLLTYSAVLAYPAHALAGAPATRTRIWARQCESLCADDGRIVITNEERDVFVVDARLLRSSASLSPPRARLTLSAEEATPIPLHGAAPGDALGWRREGDALHLRFAFALDDSVAATSIDPVRLGGAILFVFGDDETTRIGAGHALVAVGRRPDGTFHAWRGDGAGGLGALSPFDAAVVTAAVSEGSGSPVLAGEIVLPLAAVVEDPDSFLFDARTIGLRDDDGPYVSGLGSYSMYRPYTWAVVRTTSPVSG